MEEYQPAGPNMTSCWGGLGFNVTEGVEQADCEQTGGKIFGIIKAECKK